MRSAVMIATDCGVSTRGVASLLPVEPTVSWARAVMVTPSTVLLSAGTSAAMA